MTTQNADDLGSAFHPAVLSAESTDFQANTLTRIASAISLGGRAALASGALSIYNTVVDVLPGEQVDIDTEDFIRRFSGDEMGDYYAENKQVLDIVGFVGTAILPASLGIKGLQLLRTGAAGNTIARSLGYTQSRSRYWLHKGLQETAENGGALPGILQSAARKKQLGWEIADNALLGSAAEIAVVGMMHDSPIFAEASLGDFAWNMALGTVLSGGIGGTFGSIAARGIFKQAGADVQLQLRQVDVVDSAEHMALMPGSAIASHLSDILSRQQGLDSIPFSYRFGGVVEDLPGGLNISRPVQAAREQATRAAEANIALQFNKLALGNEGIGQLYKDFVFEGVEAARAAGKSPQEISALLHGYLANVKHIEPIDLERKARDARNFYVTTAPAGNTPQERLLNAFTLERTTGTSKQAYRLADDFDPANLVIVTQAELNATSLREVWRMAPDADAVVMPNGSFRFNPKSKNILKVHIEPFRIRMFMDARTGEVTDEIVPTFGDLAVKDVAITRTHVSTGNQSFNFTESIASSITMAPVQAGARFAWASQRSANDLLQITGGRINADDLPLLQRLTELSDTLKPSMLAKFNIVDGDTVTNLAEMQSFAQFVLDRRLELFAKQMETVGNAAPDTRVIAANLGTTQSWVEEVISTGYRPLPDNIGILPTEAALKPRHAEVTWDFGVVAHMAPKDAYRMNMGPNHLITMELTTQYQKAISRRVSDTAVLTSLGDDAALIVDFEAFAAEGQTAAQSTTTAGAGARTLGAANADYGSRAEIAAQESGKNVALLTHKRRDAVVAALAPSIEGLRNSKASALELGMVTAALRGSEFQYTLDPSSLKLISLQAAYAMRRTGETLDEVLTTLQPGRGEHVYDLNHEAVYNFLKQHATINADRLDKMTPLWNAAGMTAKHYEFPVVYVPPINTVRAPYHAFVRIKPRMGHGSGTSMIVAKTEDELRMMAAKLKDDFDVYFDKDVANYYKAKGEYDYDLTMNQALVDSELKRRGILSSVVPDVRFENVMEDYLQWHARQEQKHVRLAVQVKNRQFFNEVNFLSEQYRKVSESVVGGVGSRFKAKVADPFGDYMKTALDISKQQEFPLLDSLNEFIDDLGVSMGRALERARRDARAGTISYEEANEVAKKFGLGVSTDVYPDLEAFVVATDRYPMNVIRETFQKANMILATTMLRFDMANSIVNVISSPILMGTELSSIRGRLAAGDPLLGKLNELMSIQVPGKPYRMPSNMKLMATATENYFKTGNKELIARYQGIGTIKDVSMLYHEILDSISFRPFINGKQWVTQVDGAVEKAATLTGNNLSEEFSRFIASDVMRQLTDPIVAAKKMTVKEQNAYIASYVNRSMGNYTTSQRPIIFQGTVGASVSLFQTYVFNVLQQLFRHMQAGDKKTLAIFAGLQSSVFGLNGLPFFEAVNTHLISNWIADNPDNKDFYSVLPGFNKELGDWMLYGTASAFPLFTGVMPALYSRGDLNPRHITILPSNPLDIPAVSASLKLVDAIHTSGRNIVAGADVSESLLRGLEHQGWNRPLAGFAQLLGGQSVTSRGSLISAANDMEITSMLGSMTERMTNYGGISRLMGARPMDEALALDVLYRQKTYMALDRARISRLGEVVRTRLNANEMPTEEELEDFMLRYMRAGGRIENFSRAMQRWSRDANVSIVNQLADRLSNPYGQTLQELMGGERVSDYRSQIGAEPPIDGGIMPQ